MSKSAKTLLLWIVLIMMMAAIWHFLSPEHPPAPSDEAPASSWAITAGVGGVLLAALYAFRRYVLVAQQHNQALGTSNAHLEAGRFDQAEQAARSIAASRVAAFRRLGLLQRAEIAARRGDRGAALARIDEVLALPIGLLFAAGQRGAVVRARGLAALLRASRSSSNGDEPAARAHIEAVRAYADADAAALARASLAEAVLLDRSGDRAALRDLVERSRALWLAATPRYERALARAYEAMLDAGSAPVYRQQADRAEAAAERDPVAAWVAQIAPNAAPFVRSAPPEANAAPRVEPMRDPSDEARHKVEAARPEIKPKSSNTLALWVLLVLAFLGVWSAGISWLPPVAISLGVAAFAAWIGLTVRRSRAEGRRLEAGVRAFGLGDLERAATELAFEPKSAWKRVQAAHFRAEIAAAKGDMKAALAETDRALAALAEAQGGKVVQPTPPAAGAPAVWDFPRVIATQRAFALAVLGRADEARAEIRWANGLPDALIELRVALVEKLAVHDFDAAACLVEGRDPSVALSVRDEVLFDLIRYVARPAARDAAAAARIRADLRRTPHLPAWIDAVAPGLTAAFEVAAEGAGRSRIVAEA